MINLNNKTAIVTGASRGIGKAITQGLCNAGCKLALISNLYCTILPISLINIPHRFQNRFNI